MKIKKFTLVSVATLAIAVAPIITPAISSVACTSTSIRTTEIQRDQTTNTFTRDGQDTNSPLNRPNRISQTARISFVPGYSIQVWTMTHTFVYDSNGRLKKLRDGTSITIYGKTSVNGNLLYQIGDNQWVESTYVTLVK